MQTDFSLLFLQILKQRLWEQQAMAKEQKLGEVYSTQHDFSHAVLCFSVMQPFLTLIPAATLEGAFLSPVSLYRWKKDE